MADILVHPQLVVHEIAAGGVMSGVAPDGTDSAETIKRGLYRVWAACTVGGLIQLPAATFGGGCRLRRVLWNLPGVGSLTINAVDDAAFVYPVQVVAAAAGHVAFDEGGFLIPAGWAIQLVGLNPLGALGRAVVELLPGWDQGVFDAAPMLGKEWLVPSKPVP